jgi:polyisoprenoid-binding protein YceI
MNDNHLARIMALSGLTALLLCTQPLLAANYTVTPADSQLAFSSSVSGESFDGRFDRYRGQIAFDPAALADTRFAIEIDVASVDTDSEERDEVLVTPEWFDPKGHPQARFDATGAVADGPGYISEGQLSLRGIARPVRFRFELAEDGSRLRGTAELNRLDWQLGGEEWADDELVAFEVQVRVDVRLLPVN